MYALTGSMAVQKNAPARYISIQQAQQMGLLSGGKITQVCNYLLSLICTGQRQLVAQCVCVQNW